MKLKKIAVTGSLSSGKSTVCQFFKELGAYVLSADEIVHRLLTPEKLVGQQVVDLFGKDILTNNQIDRTKIAKKAFSDPKLLAALEHLLHPKVRDEIEKEYRNCSSKFTLFVVEIPLLFETGADAEYPIIITVTAPKQQCQQRFKKGVKSAEQDYQKRMDRQLSIEEKISRATYVIHNDGSLEKLKEAVAKIYEQLK
jgi:dephospho-CoA kinase